MKGKTLIAGILAAVFLFLPFLTIEEAQFLQSKKEEARTENQEKYSVKGLFFVSKTAEAKTVARVEEGIASWYGPGFHGRTTANGEKYDMYALTAAHRELPFGTRVRVISLETKKEVTVVINDRGPYIRGRIIDLSMRSAELIGLKEPGIGRVKLEILR